MIYSLGDKFLINGLLTEVLYTNAGMAWIGPSEDEGKDLKGVAFSVLDESGKDKQGNKAISVSNDECLAV